MSKIICIVLSLLISACAVSPESQSRVNHLSISKQQNFDPVDSNCALLAKTTKAIAIAREVGIPPHEVELVVAKVPYFPLGSVIRDVYSHRGMNVIDSMNSLYNKCRLITFNSMIQLLHTEEFEFLKQEKENMIEVFNLAKKRNIVQTKKTVPEKTRSATLKSVRMQFSNK